MERVPVNEGKSVDLKTEVKDIKRVDLIEWRFEETLIAEINPAKNIFKTYDGDKGRFRGKLKLNPQTGDLTIKHSIWEHEGVYKLKIIRDGETSYRKFNVILQDETRPLPVYEGKSVDLKTKVIDIKRVDLIEWRFRETLIAEINLANNIFSTYDDNLFKDKLKLNRQTGNLNINAIRGEHTGVYKLKIIRDGKTSYKRYFVFVRVDQRRRDPVKKRGGDLVEKRGEDSVEKRGKDSEEKRGEDSVEKRGGDSVRIEMQPLLPKSSQ